MNKLQILTTVLASSFGLSFLSGMFGWEMDDGMNLLLGIIDIVCIVWLLVVVYKD